MKKIGILRGGIGEHYAASLERGGEVIAFLAENFPEKYKPMDILVDRDGLWHLAGVPVYPADLAHRVDLVWNSAHHSFSQILESVKVPHIPASVVHKFSKSREMLKEHLQKLNMSLTRHLVFPDQADFSAPNRAKEVHAKFSPPWLVRPFGANTSVVAKTFAELVDALSGLADSGRTLDLKSGSRPERRDIVVEEYVSGRGGETHSVAGFRGQEVYVFPTEGFNLDEKELLAAAVRKLHAELGHPYLHTKLTIHPTKKIYLVNLSFTPNFMPGSAFALACDFVGAKPEHVLEHMIESNIK